MKQLFIIILLSACFESFAQPELVALINGGGANRGGTIIKYSGGNNTIAQKYDLSDSAGPAGSLIQASNGLMYGLTRFDGATHEGTLFEYNYLSNTYTVKVNFHGATGYSPQASLVQGADGKLYGMTWRGGVDSGGTLFSYTIGSNTVDILHSFSSSNYSLGTLIQSKNGRLYGMSRGDGAHSGGTIFSYNISTATFHTDYDLPANSIPYNTLLETDTSVLYGMSFYDGANGGGTIFRYIANARTSPFTILHDFGANDHPRGSLIMADNGKLYGGVGGNSSSDLGYLFSYDIGGNHFDTVYKFTGGINGSSPYGTLFQASDGLLYGTTYFGGAQSRGTIFQYAINQHSYTKTVDLDTSTGLNPLHGHFIEYQPVIHTNINETNGEDLRIYGVTTAIRIERNNNGPVEITITDILGRSMAHLFTAEQNIEIPILPSAAPYIVDILHNNIRSIKKVAVR